MLFSREPLPAAVTAARETALAKAGAALADALSKASAARQALDGEKAALVECGTELANLPDPGVEEDAIRAFRDRRSVLEIKRAGYAPRIVAAEAEASARDAEAVEARRAVIKAMAELDAPTLAFRPADLPRLQAEAAKAGDEADKAAAKLEKAEREGADALAAFGGLRATGASEADGRRIIADRKAASERIAAASSEHEARASVAKAAEQRASALEAAIERDRRARDFEAGVRKLEDLRAGLMSAIEIYNETGAQLGRLQLTCATWLRLLQTGAERRSGHIGPVFAEAFMLAPTFAGSFAVPRLNQDNWFVSSHWMHRYEDFETRADILDPLKKALSAQDADHKGLLKAGSPIFIDEYERLGRKLLECLAVLQAWRVERDALFAAAGDFAAGVAKPAFPLSFRNSEDQPCRRLSLPSLRNGSAPFWSPDWKPERLLVVTRPAAEAA